MKQEIMLNTTKVAYELRRNKRSKRITLTINYRGLVVSAPQGTSMQHVEQVLVAKQEWIIQKLKQIGTGPVKQLNFNSGDSLAYLGDPVQLIVQQDTVSRYVVQYHQGQLTVKTPWISTQRSTGIANALTAWYTEQAIEFLQLRIKFWAEKIQVRYNRVTVKALTSRWGSCSRLGNLNFNFRLIMAPVPIVDYVIIHELCHLKELNHSPQFWREVGQYCPDYQQRKRWLKDNGFRLFIL